MFAKSSLITLENYTDYVVLFVNKTNLNNIKKTRTNSITYFIKTLKLLEFIKNIHGIFIQAQALDAFNHAGC